MKGKFVSSLQKASSENLSRTGFSEEAFFVSQVLSKGQIYGRLASKSGCVSGPKAGSSVRLDHIGWAHSLMVKEHHRHKRTLAPVKRNFSVTVNQIQNGEKHF